MDKKKYKIQLFETKMEIVVAFTKKDHGIGLDGTIPWKLSGDMKYFRNLTTKTEDCTKQNACIMGRKTYFSIPEKFRPLPNRFNVIVSRNKKLRKENNIPSTVIIVDSLEEAYELCFESLGLSGFIERVFVLGGGEIYQEALRLKFVSKIWATSIEQEFECDTFFPNFEDQFQLCTTTNNEIQKENGMVYQFLEYAAKPKLYESNKIK